MQHEVDALVQVCRLHHDWDAIETCLPNVGIKPVANSGTPKLNPPLTPIGADADSAAGAPQLENTIDTTASLFAKKPESLALEGLNKRADEVRRPRELECHHSPPLTSIVPSALGA